MKLPPPPPLSCSSRGCRNNDLGGGKVLVITGRLVASYSSLVFRVVVEILDCLGPELVEGSSHGRLLEELAKQLGSGLLPLGRSFPFVARWAGRRWCKMGYCIMLEEDLRDARRKPMMFLLVSSFLYYVFLLPRRGVVAPKWGWLALELCKGCKAEICILDYFSAMCWTEHAVHMIKVVDEGISDVYVDIPDLVKVLSSVFVWSNVRTTRFWCNKPWEGVSEYHM